MSRQEEEVEPDVERAQTHSCPFIPFMPLDVFIC